MSNYAEYIVAGKPVGIKFGMPACRRILSNLDAHEVIKDGLYMPLGIARIFLAGYENDCQVKERVATLTLEDFNDQVEEALIMRDDEGRGSGWDAVEGVLKCFNDSMIVKSMLDKAKKKMIQQQMERLPEQSESLSTPINDSTKSSSFVTDNSA